jgi:hypothetical protein
MKMPISSPAIYYQWPSRDLFEETSWIFGERMQSESVYNDDSMLQGRDQSMTRNNLYRTVTPSHGFGLRKRSTEPTYEI